MANRELTDLERYEFRDSITVVENSDQLILSVYNKRFLVTQRFIRPTYTGLEQSNDNETWTQCEEIK